MTLQAMLRAATQTLGDGQAVRLLAEDCFALTAVALHTQQALPPAAQQAVFADKLARLCAGEPLQYVLGHWQFCGLEFKTDARALIPRPETELLVCLAAQLAPQGATVLDAGCGSGCIGIALKHLRADLAVTLLDISAPALQLAAENAALLGVDVGLLQGDMREPLPCIYDVLLSNPPYIAPWEEAQMDACVRQWEPPLALYGGADGLCFYRALRARAKDSLQPGGFLAAECGFAQAAHIQTLWQDTLTDLQVCTDDAGIARVVWGRKNH